MEKTTYVLALIDKTYLENEQGDVMRYDTLEQVKQAIPHARFLNHLSVNDILILKENCEVITLYESDTLNDKPLYLNLFHGRKESNEHLENWGEDGPILGLFKHIHFTYMSTIICTDLQGNDYFLQIENDCIYYDGVFYGDFIIESQAFLDENPLQRIRFKHFEESKIERKK